MLAEGHRDRLTRPAAGMAWLLAHVMQPWSETTLTPDSFLSAPDMVSETAALDAALGVGNPEAAYEQIMKKQRERRG